MTITGNTNDEYYAGQNDAKRIVALMGLAHAQNLATDPDLPNDAFDAGFRAYVESLVQS